MLVVGKTITTTELKINDTLTQFHTLPGVTLCLTRAITDDCTC